MFDFIGGAVSNVLNIAGGLLDGELPTQDQVVKLAYAGLTIHEISEATGLALDLVEGFLND